MIADHTVVIVGAGPYGLSLAAHFNAQGIKYRIFGEPMRFWSKIAAGGDARFLKSFPFATSLSAPAPGSDLIDYIGSQDEDEFSPCSMRTFMEYGKWFQNKNVPQVEPYNVVNIKRGLGGFIVSLETGETVNASQVIVATGLANFSNIPEIFADLSDDRVYHTVDLEALDRFVGKRVAVIGAGQSALEAAALLHEVGALPHLLVREDKVVWHVRVNKKRSWWEKVRKPVSGLGVGPKAWALFNFPGLLHMFPDRFRAFLARTYLSAEGAWWLRSRVEGIVPIQLNTTVLKASEVGGEVALVLSSREQGEQHLAVDLVVAGSGYQIDVDCLEFLDQGIRREIERVKKSPRLSSKFESSVDGLYFIGPIAAMSFGPLFRFVVGADYTARTISRYLERRSAGEVDPRLSFA